MFLYYVCVYLGVDDNNERYDDSELDNSLHEQGEEDDSDWHRGVCYTCNKKCGLVHNRKVCLPHEDSVDADSDDEYGIDINNDDKSDEDENSQDDCMSVIGDDNNESDLVEYQKEDGSEWVKSQSYG